MRSIPVSGTRSLTPTTSSGRMDCDSGDETVGGPERFPGRTSRLWPIGSEPIRLHSPFIRRVRAQLRDAEDDPFPDEQERAPDRLYDLLSARDRRCRVHYRAAPAVIRPAESGLSLTLELTSGCNLRVSWGVNS